MLLFLLLNFGMDFVGNCFAIGVYDMVLAILSVAQADRLIGFLLVIFDLNVG